MDSIQKEVFVSGPPVSQFEMDTMEGCAVLPVNFTNTSIGYQFVNYSWDFGNGETSQLEQPVTIYYEQGLRDTFYYINLNATNHCGSDDYMDSVHVYPKPLASIKLSQDYGCTALPVAFNNLTQGLPDYFAWYIDGVLYSTDSIAPSRLFTATGEDNELYTIEFVAYNECGTDTATNIITVLPDSLRAFFSVDRNVGCEPLTITFDNSTAPDSLVVYNWYFDQNGDTSTEEDELYTFYASGDTITKYTVVLVANNGCAIDSFAIDITVYPAPKVDFEAPLYACAEDTVQFISQSVDVNGYLWEFGDGDTSTMTNPVHLFNNYGQYWVKMTAFAAGTGCPASDSAIINIRELPTPKLDVTSIFGCPPLTVNLINQTENPTDYYYRWDFGDGNTAVGTNPGNHTYFGTGTYGVTLWAVDVYGCDNDTVFQAVTVYPVPNADFEIINQDTCGVPLQVCFDNNSSGAAGYNWDLGNGSLSVQNSPCTVYNNPGEVEITLLASNEFLCKDTISKLFKVYDTPKAAFDVAKTVICEESSLFFQNNSVNHEFSVWTFHNGTDTTSSPTWLYPDTGYFDVKLVVGNGSGCKDSISLEDFILVQTSPIANFFHDRIDNALPTTFQFTDDSSPDALFFEWDFGDGEQSDEENPMHRYLSSFDKVVLHWVTNEYGCTDTASTIINLDTLAALYIPNIMEPESGDHPEKRVFQPKGIGLAEFHVAVYARTGQLVWESTELDMEGIPTEFWDGRMLGEEMPSGVYVWKVHKAKFIDGTDWDGMKDENEVPRRSNFLYLVR
jgi:PKD repeat protein